MRCIPPTKDNQRQFPIGVKSQNIPPVVCIVGFSGAGKTTVTVGLVRALKHQGLRAGTIKHDVHGFEIDRPGKDSWRYKQAGASATIIPAALFMMVSRTLINSLAVDNRSPSVVLEKANNVMCQNNDSGMFVTVFLAFYDVSTGKLTATNGGQSASLIIDPDGTSREWAANHGTALGFMEELPYKEETIDLKVDQTLFLYTDGVTEAMSPGNELFGLDRLRGLLKRKHDFKLNRLCSDIEISLSEFQEGHQFDDITMLALKRIM